MNRPLPRALFLVGLASASCATGGVTSSIVPITALEVDPAEFLGAVTCEAGDGGTGRGGMRAYVATIYDVSRFHLPGTQVREGLLTSAEACYPAKECLALPSSKPTSCFLPVDFQRIVTGRQYVADVDGYDRSDIVPIAEGSRIMVDPKTKAVVPPRWTTSCGRKLAPNDPGPYGVETQSDAATPRDAATPSVGGSDAGDAGARIPTLPEHADAGLFYYECRSPYRDGQASWLDGPVCAFVYETETFRGCYPLRDRAPAQN